MQEYSSLSQEALNYVKILEEKNKRLEKRLDKALVIYKELREKITELDNKVIELETFIIEN